MQANDVMHKYDDLIYRVKHHLIIFPRKECASSIENILVCSTLISNSLEASTSSTLSLPRLQRTNSSVLRGKLWRLAEPKVPAKLIHPSVFVAYPD